jgi:hypothetical protein
MRQTRQASASTSAQLAALMERRDALCRLVPERALDSLDDAEAFLRDRGMLTLMPDCGLPSLFGACHEEPYRAGGHGFASWPMTKWPWSFALRERPGVYVLKIHRGKGLYVTAETAQLVDPLCREALTAAETGEYGPEAERLLRHLAATGPALLEDLKDQLVLSAASLRSVRAPLERVGALVSHEVALGEDGERQSSELFRWDQVFPVPPASVPGGLEELFVAGVRAAVVAPEDEARHWFSWGVSPEMVERLIAEGRLLRLAPGLLALVVA